MQMGGRAFSDPGVLWIMEMALRLENDDKLFEHSIGNRSLSYLLCEEISREDVEELRAKVGETTDALGKVLDAVPVDKFPKLNDHLNSLMDAVNKSQTFVAELDLDDPSSWGEKAKAVFGQPIKTARALQAILAVQAKVNIMDAALRDGIPFVLKNLDPFMTSNDLKVKKLDDVAGNEGIPDSSKLAAGFSKAIKKSMPGTMTKAVDWLRGKVGTEALVKDIKDVEPRDIGEEFLELSYNEIAGINDAIKGARPAPEVDQGTIRDIGAEEEGGDVKSWNDVVFDVIDGVEDTRSAKKILNVLSDDPTFQSALKNQLKFESAYTNNYHSLTQLLFEELGFEEFIELAKKADIGDDVDEKVFVDVANAINAQVPDAIVDIKAPTPDAADEDEIVPASEEEASEEQDNAQAELEDAIQDAAASDAPPGVAIMAAIDGWVSGLSNTSQQSLQSRDRIGGLKANLQIAIDGAADTLEDAVKSAVNKWRGEHEVTLTNSRRFAKKNFDALEELIPQLAQRLLAKTNESGLRLTQGMIIRTVYKYLNKKFRRGPTLSEVFIPANDLISVQKSEDSFENEGFYPENDMIRYRLIKMAGLDR